jgi:hypothetical protein
MNLKAVLAGLILAVIFLYEDAVDSIMEVL